MRLRNLTDFLRRREKVVFHGEKLKAELGL